MALTLHYRIQVNHLSTCLLILLLVPILARTAETYNSDPHVTIVSSDLHLMVKRLPRKVIEQPAILEALSQLSNSRSDDC
jgi:retinol dehydrogenase-12